jgi:hypothetical protein
MTTFQCFAGCFGALYNSKMSMVRTGLMLPVFVCSQLVERVRFAKYLPNIKEFSHHGVQV